MSVILLVSALMVPSITSKPWIDFSERNGPSNLFLRMVDQLSADETVINIRWNYEQLFLYYRHVKKIETPFGYSKTKETCKHPQIIRGNCFTLSPEPELSKGSEKVYFTPFMRDETATLYQLTTGATTPDLIKLTQNNPSPPVGAIKISRISEDVYKIEVGQIGWEMGDPIKGEARGMRYTLILKSRGLKNEKFQEWPPSRTDEGYKIEGFVWKLGADSLYAHGLQKVKFAIRKTEGNFATRFNAYYTNNSRVPIKYVTLARDATNLQIEGFEEDEKINIVDSG